jgi:hypothetical protein
MSDSDDDPYTNDSSYYSDVSSYSAEKYANSPPDIWNHYQEEPEWYIDDEYG